MKQVGISLLVMTVLGVIAIWFNLDDTPWETAFGLVILATGAFIPSFKQILAWKFHWRLALVVAVICTFVVLLQLMQRLLGDYRAYAMPASLLVFSLLAFLFHYLDHRDVSRKQTGSNS